MKTYTIAHIEERGVSIIIIPFDPSFGKMSRNKQNKIMDELQIYAQNSGISGTVVPVWPIGKNHGFIAPPKWHPFFKKLSWDEIMSLINKEIEGL
jgi:hypothetical protein